MFKSRLNQIMKAQKISGKELSQTAGISESTISKFLSGNQEPKFSQIIQISKALHLPTDVFISIICPQFEISPPLINEFCLIQEIFNDASSGLHITTFISFKEFTLDMSDMVDADSLYITIILEGGTDSKLGQLRTGDYHIIKGKDYKGVKMTIHKGTRSISYGIYDSPTDITKRWSRIFSNGLVHQEKGLLK